MGTLLLSPVSFEEESLFCRVSISFCNFDAKSICNFAPSLSFLMKRTMVTYSIFLP